LRRELREHSICDPLNETIQKFVAKDGSSIWNPLINYQVDTPFTPRGLNGSDLVREHGQQTVQLRIDFP